MGENILIVTAAEAGQKLLRFLERRLGLPRAQFFRWLRTGQVRVNKGRAKPDLLLRAGDAVRLPPQAAALSANVGVGGSCLGAANAAAARAGENPPGLDIVYEDENFLFLNKQPGLPTQPGSRQVDSLSSRLRAAYREYFFVPAPAHRLDKQSSGVLAAGKTHLAQRYLSELFQSGKSALERDYLAWVGGSWKLPQNSLLRDFLRPEKGADGLERMTLRQGSFNKGEDITGMLADGWQEALALCSPLLSLDLPRLGAATLLKIRLLSGRKHQIRVQCAGRGFPLIGDARYGGRKFLALLLHACHVKTPACADYFGAQIQEAEVFCPPAWPEPFTVNEQMFRHCKD